MRTPTAARITWLLPDPMTREVYRAHRGILTADELPAPGGLAVHVDERCLQCGAVVTAAGTGTRAPITALIRDRKSSCRHLVAVRLHHGCIPRPGETPQRIRARALRSSQVRAGVE